MLVISLKIGDSKHYLKYFICFTPVPHFNDSTFQQIRTKDNLVSSKFNNSTVQQLQKQ